MLPDYEDGEIPTLYAGFMSPLENNNPYTFAQRALHGDEDIYDLYIEIEPLIDDIPFNMETGDVIPWFGKVGGGKQAKWNVPKAPPNEQYPYTLNQLVELGYIKVTIKSSPNGMHSNLIGTVLE